MSQARKGIVDIPVIVCDKAMNWGWTLTSKDLNKETGICDSEINVIFPFLFLFLHQRPTKQALLSDIYETVEWEGCNWYDCY